MFKFKLAGLYVLRTLQQLDIGLGTADRVVAGQGPI